MPTQIKRIKRIFFILSSVSLIASCGPSKVDECTDILNAFEASRSQQQQGQYTRELVLHHAALDEQLISNYQSMEIRNTKLQDYLNILVTGLQTRSTAMRAYAELVGPDGTVSIRSGDTAREQAWQNVQSQQSQASNQINLGYSQILSFCSI